MRIGTSQCFRIYPEHLDEGADSRDHGRTVLRLFNVGDLEWGWRSRPEDGDAIILLSLLYPSAQFS